MKNAIAVTPAVERAWIDFVEASMKAQTSRLMSDGIRAGHAWRRWLDLFMSDEARQRIGKAL